MEELLTVHVEALLKQFDDLQSASFESIGEKMWHYELLARVRNDVHEPFVVQFEHDAPVGDVEAAVKGVALIGHYRELVKNLAR